MTIAPGSHPLEQHRTGAFTVGVIDGQGGGIGSLIVKRLRDEFGDRADITALGTNAVATAAMMRVKANRGATGENAIARNVPLLDAICGSISIVLAHGFLGEMTPEMAESVSRSAARKYLIPLNQESVQVLGTSDTPLPHLIEELILRLKETFHV